MKLLLNSLAFIALAISTTLIGCNKTPSSSQLETITLTEQMRVDELYNEAGDTIFFGVIKSMECFDNELYILCQEPKQVMRLDSDLRFKNVVAREGRAQYEYTQTTTLCYDKGNLLIGDYGKSGFMRFSRDGQHIENHNIGGINTMTGYRQAVNNGTLYTNDIDIENGTRFASIDLATANKTQACAITRRNNELRTMVRNLAHTFIYGDDIITFESDHIVARYNKDWQLIESCDLRVIPAINQLIQNDETENGNSMSADVIVFDACVGGDYMYIIYQTLAWEGEHTKVLAVNLKGKIAPAKYLLLEGEKHFCICANDHYIFACPNDGGEIVKYRLP